MKIKIYILSAALLLSGSCINKIDFSGENAEPAIVMNSFLDSGKEVQQVFLSISKQHYVEAPDMGRIKLKVSVNGTNIEDINIAPDADKKEILYKEFLVKASIKPGDKIIMTAEQGELKAFSEAETPFPATITKADTARGVKSLQKNNKIMRFTANILDIKGQRNWYKIELVRKTKVLDKGGNTLVEETAPVSISCKEDPILGAESNDSEQFLGFPLFSDYDVFSDKEFQDGEHELKFMADMRKLYRISSLEDLYSQDETLHVDLDIKLYSINQEAFKYLKNLGAVASGLYDMGLMEPLMLSQNVQGGLGFVTAMSPAIWTISLPVIKTKDVIKY